MHLIKVNAINSTNSFAREMFRENNKMPATCILAKKQLEGRGQRGTQWNSEEGKNLTFSVIYPKPALLPGRQFILSAAVATTVLQVLEKFDLPRLKVKWPNDILSANRKIGGILIENVISEAKVAASVIGIGLNVNQQQFEGLPGAGSMSSVCGREFDLDQVLEQLLAELEVRLDHLSEETSEEILDTYKNHLFKRECHRLSSCPMVAILSGSLLM